MVEMTRTEIYIYLNMNHTFNRMAVLVIGTNVYIVTVSFAAHQAPIKAYRSFVKQTKSQ